MELNINNWSDVEVEFDATLKDGNKVEWKYVRTYFSFGNGGYDKNRHQDIINKRL